MRWFQRILLGIATLSMIGSFGCRQTPSEVYLEARTAAESEDVEAFLPHFTRWSQSLLGGFAEVLDESRRRLEYVRSPLEIHEFGEVTNETITEDLAILKLSGSSESVILVVEEGVWRIDALRLASFWEPIR